MSSIPIELLPNLLYLFLLAGIWTGSLAIITPGTGVYELLALMTLGGVGFGLLYVPYNPLALVPLILGVLLFIYGLWKPHYERYSNAGAAILISLGSVFLFELEEGGAAVNPLLAIVMTVFTIVIYWYAIRNITASQRLRSIHDPTLVLNARGEVRTRIDPIGTVYVGGELWSAWADDKISEGETIRVVGKEGLVLQVERDMMDEEIIEGDK
jgi:membrane-bound serine protease (ClpP class)